MSLQIQTSDGIHTMTGSRDLRVGENFVSEGNLRCVTQNIQYSDDNVNWDNLPGGALADSSVNAIFDTTGTAAPGRKYRVVTVYGLNETNSNVVTIPAAVNLSNNLQAYYALDYNTDDSTPNGYDLVTGVDSFIAGKSSGSLDGNDGGYKQLGTTFDFNNKSYSISFWFNLQGTGGQTLVDWGDFGGIPTRITAGSIDHNLYDGSGWNTVTSGVALSTGTWYHCVVRYDSVAQTLKISVNNTTATQPGVSPAGASGGNQLFSVGRESWGNQSNAYIDEVAVWYRALTDAEVTALYNSGTGLFYPGF